MNIIEQTITGIGETLLNLGEFLAGLAGIILIGAVMAALGIALFIGAWFVIITLFKGALLIWAAEPGGTQALFDFLNAEVNNHG